MKKYILRIAAVLALFIPTYLAIFFYVGAKDDPVDSNSVFAVDFLDTRGKMTHYERSDPEGEKLIALFLSINDSAMSSDSLPSELEDAEYISLTYYSYDMQTEYRYYFSPGKPSSSYYTDHDGNAYRIPAMQAIEFLDSDFSACLYESSVTPVLTVLGKEYPADEMEWKYYSYSGTDPHTVPLTNTDSKIPTLKTSYKSFDFGFDRLPDESAVTVTDAKGNPIFEGSLIEYQDSAVVYKTVRADTTLIFTIDAVWNAGYGKSGFGSAAYSFRVDVLFDPDASFWLSTDHVETGEFAVLSGMYVEDLDALEVSCTPSIGYRPIFFSDGDLVRALLPIPFDADAAETDYTITIKYHSIVRTLKLTVQPSTANVKTRKYNYSNLIDLSTRSKENLGDFIELISSLPYEQQIYFSGIFRTPDESQNRARFGDPVNNGKEADRFISNGIAWVSYKGQAVYAANSGKVIYVGETAMGGNTVVVDHGLGLRSVYYCLGTVTVQVGDFVTSESQIGTGGGKSGYTDGHTCYQEFWVGSVPVSHYPLAREEIVFGENTD